MEEMNRLTLLQEIESTNEEVSKEDTPEDNGKGKEKEPSNLKDSFNELPNIDAELDHPSIQEEAALTYERSRECNNLEKFMCLLLIEWGESVLNQVRPTLSAFRCY